MIFQTISKSVIAFVRLIFGKVGVDRLTRPGREIDIRYEFDSKVILKEFREQTEILAAVLD